MPSLSRHVLLYGSDTALPDPVRLRAGPLSLVFEQGDIRSVMLGEHEVLRRVYVALRDPNWLTIAHTIRNLRVRRQENAFSIDYDAEHKEGNIDFRWHGRITGSAEGEIVFSMDGVAHSAFWYNRIGFCVLHPVEECAGRPCTVEKVDGTTETGCFPYFIAPHQPFRNMRGISHLVAPGVWADVRCEGDTFEMEDQRNWTDGSYKTYSRPLSLPRPVELKAGERIQQRVTVRLRGGVAAGVGSNSDTVVITVGDDPVGLLPRIGLAMAGHGVPLTAQEALCLRAMALSHLRVDLRLSDQQYLSVLEAAVAQSELIGVPLEVAVFVSDDAARELRDLAGHLTRIRPRIATWLVFHADKPTTTSQLIGLAKDILGFYDKAALIGGGTDRYFTELNRFRPPAEGLDLVAYSVHPTEHAFDNTSLMENLEGQAWTVRSARQFCRASVAVTPIGLRRRWNVYASQPEPTLPADALPPQVDARQMSLFGAAWTLGSIKYLAESGAASLTYYETTGWRGVMETEKGSPLPQHFPSLPGAVFPLYHVLADVAGQRGAQVVPVHSSKRLAADGLALRCRDSLCVLVANLTAQEREVLVGPLPGRVRVRLLDESTVLPAMQQPEAFRAYPGSWHRTRNGELRLALKAYAVARVEAETVAVDSDHGDKGVS